jgi:hypothetical protein
MLDIKERFIRLASPNNKGTLALQHFHCRCKQERYVPCGFSIKRGVEEKPHFAGLASTQ